MLYISILKNYGKNYKKMCIGNVVSQLTENRPLQKFKKRNLTLISA